jgi:hypothetical protein
VKVFISYRRGDTQDFTGRLADKLRAARGIAQVFLDVEEIDAGEDFVRRIRKSIAESEVCLIVVGAKWADESGAVRLRDDGDFVRLEVIECLKSGHRIVPVLANDAAMPAPDVLPPELQDLTRLNAVSVRHADFDRDTDHLVDVIFSRKKPGALGAFFRRHPLAGLVLQSLGGAFAAFLALVVLLAVLEKITTHSLNEYVGSGLAILIPVLVTLAGAAWPWVLRLRRPAR